MRFIQLTFLVALLSFSLKAESIAEKKASFLKDTFIEDNTNIKNLHREMCEIRNQLKKIYDESAEIDPESQNKDQIFKRLLKASQDLKGALFSKEQEFRTLTENSEEQDYYSLMHESEITLEQLIVEYASSSYLYVIPSEMAKIQVNLCSSLQVPRSAWEEIVELICHQNGIGIKKLNSFVKSLYWSANQNTPALRYIVSKPEELNLIEPSQKICYVMHLEGSQFSKTDQFLKRFTNERLLSMHHFGNCLILIGEAHEIKELTKLLSFVAASHEDNQYKLIPTQHISAQDLQVILSASFPTALMGNKQEISSFIAHPMKKHLLLVGTPKDLKRACQIIDDIHDQVSTPDQMTTYWYTCKFSEPQELAALLQQVYQMMVQHYDDEQIDQSVSQMKSDVVACTMQREGTIPPICDTAPELVVKPPPAKPPANPKESALPSSLPNFIVDAKTGTIIMVVKQCYLNKLKELAKRIDVAKKMVQIEVLLFEKKINDQTQFGLNVFQLGDQSTSTAAGVNWSVDKNNRKAPGILDYFFGRSKKQGVFPAFNFAYNFLISQDDIYVHSNPTVTTVNQTAAVIDLIEEQSINMGTVEDPRTSTISNTFVRAQYGTFIQITPTVNIGDVDDDDNLFITLDTNITFDTTTSSEDDRPNVNRRHIQNQVRIGNGETLILGGLRRKNAEDHTDKIPFLGDIPGLGKLFSFTTLTDKSTEMFIFITPRVVEDAFNHFEKVKLMDLKKRPGDTPELLKKLLEAKALDAQRQQRMSLKQLFKHA